MVQVYGGLQAHCTGQTERDRVNKRVLRRNRIVDNVEATVASWGRQFQSRLPEEERARSPAVTSLSMYVTTLIRHLYAAYTVRYKRRIK